MESFMADLAVREVVVRRETPCRVDNSSVYILPLSSLWE
jgi:hypothetical protein